MLQLRKSDHRGHADHGWLKTFHTFSFADYFDKNHMGFSVLRVINEDWIEPKAGFPAHTHKDMEILTYVIEGALEHKDSMGNSSVIRPGEVQRMSAGTGVRHSEYNHLADEVTHLLQIWILPSRTGLGPSYEQKDFSKDLSGGELVLVASASGEKSSLTVQQDAKIYAGRLKVGHESWLAASTERHYWVQVIRGEVSVNGANCQAGDGLALAKEQQIKLRVLKDCELLLFDLP